MATRCSPGRVTRVTPRRDGASVNPLTTLVRSLGNDGALANARAVLEAHRREDWLVQGLAHRLEHRPAPGAVRTVAGAHRAA